MQDDVKYTVVVPKSIKKKTYSLGLAEKAKAAKTIATILNKKQKTITSKVTRVENGKKIKLPDTKIHFLDVNGENLVIVPASGHLYTLTQDGVGWQYPVYDFKWIPMHLSVQPIYRTNKHLRIESMIATIRYFAKKSSTFVIMTDYDEEGEVIGAVILSQILGEKALENVKRMHYSSLAEKEILHSYKTTMRKKKSSINFGMYYRGLMRHYLDWLWGINLSRALMLSLKNSTGQYFTLSTGRVQGPTLSFVSEREFNINVFVPVPRFKIDCTIQSEIVLNLNYKLGFLYEEQLAKQVIEKIQDASATVSKVNQRKKKIKPPSPYNLSALQNDAANSFRMSPSRTLQVAENLYLAAAISYPRTNSEKYPPNLDHKQILSDLSHQKKYAKISQDLIRKQKFTPVEGTKTDNAHPCIHPLGTAPPNVTNDEGKLYDMIVHRYLATFGEPAIIENTTVEFDINDEAFDIKGRETIDPGWTTLSGKYYKSKDQELPRFKENEQFPVIKSAYLLNYTSPEPRFSQNKLRQKMEADGIGTKATRSEIIKNLIDRKFLIEKTEDSLAKLSITSVGEIIINVLKRYSSQVLSIELSRKLERMGDLVEQTANDPTTNRNGFQLSDAIVQGITYLHQMLEDIQGNEYNVGQLISENLISQRKEAKNVGLCMVCKKGTLRILHSQTSGKRFIGCSLFFENKACNVTYPLPQEGRLEPLSKRCKEDSYPQIRVFPKFNSDAKKHKKPWTLCLNPECPKREKRKKIIKEETP
ncbi:MAG: DNA topoisomerase I [Candidatus Kariarchaeaceae archaeon]